MCLCKETGKKSLPAAASWLLLALGVTAAAPLAHPDDRARKSQSAAPASDVVTIAAVGDLLGYRKPLLKIANPQFIAVTKILEKSDAGFLNLEGAIFDLNTFEGSHGAENGGGYPLDEPEVAIELSSIGIKLVSQANNHGTDWGIEGMFASSKVLDRAGLVHAGAGATLSAARAPSYLKLPKEIIALVATASTYTPMSIAGPGGDHLNPRPGISALRNQPVTLVNSAELGVLRAIENRRDNIVPQSSPKQVSLTEGAIFRLSDSTGMTYDLNQGDRKELIEAVRDGKRNAALVVFSIHAHETASGDGDDQRPADFLTPLFHDAIDAGADEIVRHGPHTLNGIEIYHGRAIFYGMGSFFFAVGGASRQLTIEGNGTAAQRVQIKFPDSWYDSAIAVTEFRKGVVHEIRIYPLTMQMQPGPMFGAPQLASPADAKRILEKLQHDSTQFGTRIRMEGRIGVIRGPG